METIKDIMDDKERKELDCRLAVCEKNLAIISAAETAAIKWRDKVDRALFGENGGSGMVDDVRFMKKVFKIVSLVLVIAFTPVIGLLGFVTVKLLAHLDQILKLLDNLK